MTQPDRNSSSIQLMKTYSSLRIVTSMKARAENIKKAIFWAKGGLLVVMSLLMNKLKLCRQLK